MAGGLRSGPLAPGSGCDDIGIGLDDIGIGLTAAHRARTVRSGKDG
jgi:hypothetical protein